MGRGIAGALSPAAGNLRGPECVRGIITTLAKGAADGDTVVKIDSDTALLSGGWVREMKHNGLRCTPPDTGSPGTRPNGPPTEIATP